MNRTGTMACHPMPMADAPRDTLLLVNLGTPEAPTAPAVARFLREFLSDRRVVALPRWLWQPILRGIVLPRRSPAVARKYASVWLAGGSPLAVYTRALADAVQQRLPGVEVEVGMRYGAPALGAALARARARGGRVVVLPLYPQYSTTTTETVADVIADTGGRAELVRDYHDDPGWVAAVAESIRGHRAMQGRGEHLVLSFHGLPKRVVDAGDPYQRQCEASARAIADALGLADAEWSLSYQSRFGAERWLGPATQDVLDGLAARGVHKVDVACPGFAADCLETLEEIGIMLAERFAGRGGSLRVVPCLNDAPAHADAIASLASRQLRAGESCTL